MEDVLTASEGAEMACVMVVAALQDLTGALENAAEQMRQFAWLLEWTEFEDDPESR
ncbi:MAG: hypothetical protein WB992_14510 [Bryobacteraceae bacterium]